MISGTLQIAANIGGVAFSAPLTRAAAGAILQDFSGTNFLTLASTATLSTRTNNTDGELNIGANYGVVTGSVVDLYWTSGRRYGVVVGTIAGTYAPISGGAGDNLPAQGTDVTLQPQTVVDCDFLGDLLEMIAVLSTQRGRCGFYNGANLVLGLDLVGNEPYLWVGDQGIANPLAGQTVTAIKISNAVSNQIANLKIAALYNSA